MPASAARSGTGSQPPQGQAASNPTTYGKYKLIARLGRGGMGDVFLASFRSHSFPKLVVVKRLLETEDPDMRALFLDEGRLAVLLNHPNVVQTNEIGEEQGALHMCMEYLEGQPLSLLVRRLGAARLDCRVAVRIMSDVLSGLEYAHELKDLQGRSLNITHRDISPQNIFITYDGTVKILDFGIAKSNTQATQTQAGVLKGKMAYMAPEQLTGTPVDRRADIFAVGIVLWELLSGQRLFANQKKDKWVYALLTEESPRLSTILPEIDRDLEEMVARALRREREERYPTAKTMRDALEAYLARSGPSVRSDDLGELLSSRFEIDREEMRKRVQKCMSSPDLETTSELPVLPAPPPSSSSPSDSLANNVTKTIVTPPLPRWTRLALLGGGAGLAALAIYGTARIVASQPPTITAPTAIATASIQPPPAPSPMIPAPAPSPTTAETQATPAEPAPSKAPAVTPSKPVAVAPTTTWTPPATTAEPAARPTVVPPEPQPAASASSPAHQKRKFRTNF